MKRTFILWMVVALIVVVGCNGETETEPTPDLAADYLPMVSVTGEVLPKVRTVVSAQSGGQIVEIVVEEGATVSPGDVLLRLEETDARLAVQQAEAALASAEAQLARMQAGPRQEEIAVVDAQLDAAQAFVSQAAAQRDRVTGEAAEAEIAAAQAQVAEAQAAQLVARQEHDETMKCYDVPQPGGSTEEVCPALGTLEERARFNLSAANQALAAAQAQLNALQTGTEAQSRASNATVWAASAQQDVAQAQLDLLKAGATPEEIAVAEAAVQQAQAALDAAEVALARTIVRAPFAGTVGLLHVNPGEFIAPGQPLVTLGDLDTLQIETTDLDEIDVARVTEGQEVVVIFDAFPEHTFEGEVVRIAPMASPGSGGVHYTTVIQLHEWDPAIRWGMTAFVDIDTD